MNTNNNFLMNHKSYKTIFIFLFFCLISCKHTILLDQNLRNSDTVILPMKNHFNTSFGVAGISLNQGTLFSFSNKYTVHPFPIGLSGSISSLLGSGKKGAFIFKTLKGKESQIFYSDVSFGLSKSFFSEAFPGLNLHFSFLTPLCIGTFNMDENQFFYFIIKPEGGGKPGNTRGTIKFENQEIQIEGINKTDREGAVEKGTVYGYQFRYREKVVAALNLAGDKKIWLAGKLPDRIADPIVAVCSSLIERAKPQQNNDD